MLLTSFRSSRCPCLCIYNWAGKQCYSSDAISRRPFEKCRDPKDFKRYVGRPDDAARRTAFRKPRTPNKTGGSQDTATVGCNSVAAKPVAGSVTKKIVVTHYNKRGCHSSETPRGAASATKSVPVSGTKTSSTAKPHTTLLPAVDSVGGRNDDKSFKALSEDKSAVQTDGLNTPGIFPSVIAPADASQTSKAEALPVMSDLTDVSVQIADKLKLLPSLGRMPSLEQNKSNLSSTSLNVPASKPCDPELKKVGKQIAAPDMKAKKDVPAPSPASKMIMEPKPQSVNIPKPPVLKIVDELFDGHHRHRIYASGLTETGALGLYKPKEGRRLRKSMPRPLRHKFAEETRVISAECGYGFTLFYVKSNSPIKLYGCGLNSNFQLGPTDMDVVSYPIPIDIRLTSSDTEVISLSAGRAHSAVATDKEGVFLFGSNHYGQCGRSITKDDTAGKASSICTITQIKNVENEKIVKVMCGQDHTFLLTESGKLCACGLSELGQTGLGPVHSVWKPGVVEGDIKHENIVKVAGKCDTTLALNSSGEIFGWGSNEFEVIRNKNEASQVDEPIRLKHVNDKCGKIVDIAAGSSFCLVLNEEGDVFVWGHGILGGGPEMMKTTQPVLLPRTLFGFNDYHPHVRTVKVFSGLDHMMAINSVHHVYAWGKNKHGCLGIGQQRDQYFPYKLAHGAKALHISCAVDHTIVLTDHS